MPVFVITGTKTMKDGTEHVISETTASRVKSEWIYAHYRAEGYTVTINEQEQ